LRDWLAGNPKRLAMGCFEGLVPERLIEPLAASAGLEADQRAAGLPKRAQNRIVETIKGWRLGTVSEVLLEKGEVVTGGVPLEEVDPQSMRSLRCPGLYLCGEILDVAGPVGGYNLQAAFATGFVAGETAARDSATSLDSAG
jgi:predicted flavoprotein YhiN